MSFVWPPGAPAAPGLDDEYAEVAGDLPIEGDVLKVREVEYVADPRYATNGFLMIRYNENKLTRFRMKKSTAKMLCSIMKSMLRTGGGLTYEALREMGVKLEDHREDQRFKREYMGGFA